MHYRPERSSTSLLTDLPREDIRRWQAAAWRHVHRINPAVVRRIWRAVRERQRREYREAA